MRPVQTFQVAPRLPKELSSLKELASNIWWCWHPEALDLWRRLDQTLWEECHHNPVKMLGKVSQERFDELTRDEGFLAHMERVAEAFRGYLTEKPWYVRKHGPANYPQIAYFSAEFGLTESVPIYSGGLGVLAGDHLKSASDMGIPLVGIGLLYRVGYFQQYLNADGYQQERYPVNDFFHLPIKPVLDGSGNQMSVGVPLADREVRINLWTLDVGRIKLVLLDTDTPVNSAADQKITSELYGGDNETRIQQELVLGMGGLRALHALNYHPVVYHMNEGHSAFLALERIRVAMERHGLSFAEAMEETRSSNVFTTHTPVPAGIDVFDEQLMQKYFGDYHKQFGVSWKEFLALGWQENTPKGAGFSMAVLALNQSSYFNGVSRLHGEVSRGMWRELWPSLPAHEIPITSITNGVHVPSYLSREMAGLFERYMGPGWERDPADSHGIWGRIAQIPGEELWRTHERRRERLVAFARKRLTDQLTRRGAPQSEIEVAKEVLDPSALTIGFARRFATYKRATLILRDKERLIKLMTNKDRPVQFIIAGKAHPKDEPGKAFIRELVNFARDPRVRRHVVFIENYDISVSRYMVQGVDVWLNNPRRPLEASGTSGMKAAANGVLNLSILDGWWDEAYNSQVGWAIGGREQYRETEYQDQVEANALYALLEKEVTRLFYERGTDDVPRQWVDMMKTCIQQIAPVFNTNRMVREYTERFYNDAGRHYTALKADNHKRSRGLSAWRAMVRANWGKMRIESIEAANGRKWQVGDKIELSVKLALDTLTPDDVLVQAYVGPIDTTGQIINGQPVLLTHQSDGVFTGEISCQETGQMGYAVRVLPRHSDLNPIHTRLVLWS